jgi:hypothetical protein
MTNEHSLFLSLEMGSKERSKGKRSKNVLKGTSCKNIL